MLTCCNTDSKQVCYTLTGSLYGSRRLANELLRLAILYLSLQSLSSRSTLVFTRWLVMEAVVAAVATVVEVVEVVVEAAEEDLPARTQRPWVAIAAGRRNDTQTHQHTNVRTLTLAISRYTRASTTGIPCYTHLDFTCLEPSVFSGR